MKTSAPYQHFVFNIFRAVENRRYLIRAANTGISAVVNPFGKIEKKTGIYEKARLDFEIKKDDKKINSFYSKFGNIFVYFCFVYIAFYLFFTFKLKNKE